MGGSKLRRLKEKSQGGGSLVDASRMRRVANRRVRFVVVVVVTCDWFEEEGRVMERRRRYL